MRRSIFRQGHHYGRMLAGHLVGEGGFLAPLGAHRGQFSHHPVYSVVGDISLQQQGSVAEVSRTLGAAGHELHRRLCADGHFFAPGKSFFVASSKALRRRLAYSWRDIGFALCQTGRNLGVDATAGTRRRTEVRDGRLSEAIRRAAAATTISSAGAGRALAVQSVIPTALWGASVVGLPPGPLARLRSSVARMVGTLPKGSSTSASLALLPGRARLDPAHVHHRQVIYMWASTVWLAAISLEALDAALRAVLLECAAARSPWGVAKGPAHVNVVICWRLHLRPIIAGLCH